MRLIGHSVPKFCHHDRSQRTNTVDLTVANKHLVFNSEKLYSVYSIMTRCHCNVADFHYQFSISHHPTGTCPALTTLVMMLQPMCVFGDGKWRALRPFSPTKLTPLMKWRQRSLSESAFDGKHLKAHSGGTVTWPIPAISNKCSPVSCD